MNFNRIVRKIACTISPVLANKIMYRKLMGKTLNLNNPQSFNEKINWLKLYKYPSDEMVIKCTDKYSVREYVKLKGLDYILNDLYSSFDRVEDIIWSELPQKFVLKCTHGCAYNIICSDKEKLDIEDSNKKLKSWMREDFGKVTAEPHYSKIRPKIICEKYLGKDILDYKFFCFKGVPKFLYISRALGGSHHGLTADFFNMDGTKAKFRRTDHPSFKEAPGMMKNIEEAERICRILSEDFEFVRVDLFEVEGEIFFSELTFSPCSGMMPIDHESYDMELGRMINLKEWKK